MRFSALVLALVSFPALACPNLTGKYAACRSNTGTTPGESDVVVTQKAVSGATEYSVTATDDETQERETTTVRADGKARSEEANDPSSGITFKTTTTAKCQGQTLLLNVKMQFNGQPMGELNSSITKSGNQMITKTKGQMMGQAINETVTCQ